MTGQPEPFLGWPGWRHLRFAAVLSFLGTLWFVAIYGGADALTAHRTFRVRVHLDSELGIPFVPELVVVYMSIYILFLAAPLILRRRTDFFALAMTLNLVVLVGGVCFLLFPAELAFTPPKDLGAFPGLFRFADKLNLTYNLVPSLHVALSATCIAAFAERSGTTGKIALWTWAIAIALSTVLTHQHHVLDAITGFALALVAFKFIYLRWSSRR